MTRSSERGQVYEEVCDGSCGASFRFFGIDVERTWDLQVCIYDSCYPDMAPNGFSFCNTSTQTAVRCTRPGVCSVGRFMPSYSDGDYPCCDILGRLCRETQTPVCINDGECIRDIPQ